MFSPGMIQRPISIQWAGGGYTMAANASASPIDNSIQSASASVSVSASPGYGTISIPQEEWESGGIGAGYSLGVPGDLRDLFGKPAGYPLPETVTISVQISWSLVGGFPNMRVLRSGGVDHGGTSLAFLDEDEVTTGTATGVTVTLNLVSKTASVG